ncbi:hypothetical protein CR513_36314, partial [Mucuna pruriens]
MVKSILFAMMTKHLETSIPVAPLRDMFQDETDGDPHSAQMLQLLEERLKAIEGVEYSNFNVDDLCLFLNIVIPSKFKLPTFDKYRGSTCPKNHLTMYFRKIVSYTYDDKLLIHFFQEILTRVALRWYMTLDRGHVQTWRNLVEAILKQYQYSMNMAPNHTQL